MAENLINADNRTSEYCKKHAYEIAREFCFDCNTLMCEACIEDHPQGHESRSVKDTVAQFNKWIDETTGKLRNFSRFEDYLRQLKEEEYIFTSRVRKMKEYINDRGTRMKCAIDRHVGRLLKDVSKHEANVLREIADRSVGLSYSQDKLQEIRTAAKELKTEYKLSELSSAIFSLDLSMQKLNKDISTVVFEDYKCPYIRFTPVANLQALDLFNFKKNCIGSVSLAVHDEGTCGTVIFQSLEVKSFKLTSIYVDSVF